MLQFVSLYYKQMLVRELGSHLSLTLLQFLLCRGSALSPTVIFLSWDVWRREKGPLDSSSP